jgi:membrane protein
LSKQDSIGGVVTGRFRGVWQIAKHTWNDVIDNEILTRASAIAFGAMMAAVPFLALVITISALVLPAAGVDSKELLHSLESLLGTVFPDEAHRVIEEQIARLHGGQPIAVLSLSLVVTIWLASGLFAGVIDGLNRIYGVKDTRPYWKFRLTAIWMTIVQSVILLAAVGSIFAFPYLVDWVGLRLVPAYIATWVTWFVIFVMVLSSFALTFAAGPDVKQAHRWVTPGSLFGAVIFLAATYGFRLYVQDLAHYDLTYGSLGGVMMLMFWLYICSLVLLVAGEVNKVCYKAKEWSSGGILAGAKAQEAAEATAAERDAEVTAAQDAHAHVASTVISISAPPADESAGSVHDTTISKGLSMATNWNFCPNCGTKLSAQVAGQAQPTCSSCGGKLLAGTVEASTGSASSEPASAADVSNSGDRCDTASGGGGAKWEPIGPTGFGC